MSGLKLKYFVLNPKSKTSDDPYAAASRAAMMAYAEAIFEVDKVLYNELCQWVNIEAAKACVLHGKT